MAFHTRDYAFYMQFASKLLDPQVPTKTYTINPDGYNLFFFGGTEGEDSFYQSVHLEPAKYFFAGVYRLFGHPRALFLFLSLVYFFPVLYLALVGRLETGADRAFALLVMLLYVAYPSSLKAPGFDARPFILLAPFFAMSVMSVTFQRPLREQVVLMNCMFLSREEALVFALVVIGYAFLKTRDGASRRRAVAALSATWLLWFMATLSFFMWTGYRNTIHARFARLLGETPASLLMAAAVLACAVCLLVFVWKQERLWLRLSWRPAWQILGFCSLFPPLIFQFVRERSEELTSWNGAVLARTAFSPRFALHATVVALLLTILWDLVKDRRQRAAIGAFVTMATALAVTVTLTSPFGVRAMSASYLRAAPSSGPVFALREATDRRRRRSSPTTMRTRRSSTMRTRTVTKDFRSASPAVTAGCSRRTGGWSKT